MSQLYHQLSRLVWAGVFAAVVTAMPASEFGFNYWPFKQSSQVLVTWTTEEQKAVERDLDQMASLGCRVLRLMFWPKHSGWDYDAQSSPAGPRIDHVALARVQANLPHFLAMLRERHMTAVIAYGNNLMGAKKFRPPGTNCDTPKDFVWRAVYGPMRPDWDRFLTDALVWTEAIAAACETGTHAGVNYAAVVRYYDLLNEWTVKVPDCLVPQSDLHCEVAYLRHIHAGATSIPAGKRGLSILALTRANSPMSDLDALAAEFAAGQLPGGFAYYELHTYAPMTLVNDPRNLPLPECPEDRPFTRVNRDGSVTDITSYMSSNPDYRWAKIRLERFIAASPNPAATLTIGEYGARAPFVRQPDPNQPPTRRDLLPLVAARQQEFLEAISHFAATDFTREGADKTAKNVAAHLHWNFWDRTPINSLIQDFGLGFGPDGVLKPAMGTLAEWHQLLANPDMEHGGAAPLNWNAGGTSGVTVAMVRNAAADVACGDASAKVTVSGSPANGVYWLASDYVDVPAGTSLVAFANAYLRGDVQDANLQLKEYNSAGTNTQDTLLLSGTDGRITLSATSWKNYRQHVNDASATTVGVTLRSDTTRVRLAIVARANGAAGQFLEADMATLNIVAN